MSASLRSLLRPGQVLHAPGVFDAVSAALVRQAGFRVAYLSGASTSAVALGLPDLGFLHGADMLAAAARIRPALATLPLIADADTGYGNAVHARRTAQTYAEAGIAGLHIEDQVTPKRCGHLAGKEVVPVEQAAGRIRAVAEAGTGLVLIARTDALSVEGLRSATQRCVAFAAAGADLLFCEGAGPAELAQLHQAVPQLGLVLNRSEAGGPVEAAEPDDVLAELGVQLVIHPVSALLAAAAATRAAYAAIAAQGHAGGVARAAWSELTDSLGLTDLLAVEGRYA